MFNTVADFGNLTLNDDSGKLVNVESYGDFFSIVIELIFIVGLVIAIVFIIVCGIKYASSTGNPNKTEEARNCLINAFIGVIVIIAFRVLINFVLNIFGFPTVEFILLNP